MANFLISVIVPVYDKGTRLKQAINSLRCQTIASRIEIIIVDDASGDETSAIAHNYAKLYKNVRYLRNSVNKGVHESRMRGVQAASADIVGFFDADDTADPSMYERLLVPLESAKIDIAVTGFKLVRGDKSFNGLSFRKSRDFNSNIFSRFCDLEFGFGSLCNKLFRKRLIEIEALHFPWRQDSHEDMLTNIYCFLNARGVSTVPGTPYQYRRGISSSTEIKSRELALTEHFSAYALALSLCQSDWQAIEAVNKLFRRTFSAPCYRPEKPKTLESYSVELKRSSMRISEVSPEALAYYMSMLPGCEDSFKAQFQRWANDSVQLGSIFFKAIAKRKSHLFSLKGN